MRRLLYVPLIHDTADLGSLGEALARDSAVLSGAHRWRLHLEVVCRFWTRVRELILSLDPTKLKVYQDGLVADGEVGRKIVEEAARRGSKNYLLVLELIKKGSELRVTEDPALLFREHRNIRRTLGHGQRGKGGIDRGQYQREVDRLMGERDSFIAASIAATLKEGEVGVLFIGANHSVGPRLPQDITVEAVVDPEVVRAYFNELFLGRDDARLRELAQGLTSPSNKPRCPVGED